MDALAMAKIRELTLDELNSISGGWPTHLSRSALLICISTSPARGQRAAFGYATPVVATRGLLAADNYARRDSDKSYVAPSEGYASGFSIAAPSSPPELRSPVMALSLGGLRRRIGSQCCRRTSISPCSSMAWPTRTPPPTGTTGTP